MTNTASVKTICLANLHEATAQEVFDQVKNHLLKQNKKSITNGGYFYHHPDGLKCAAGCLIAEDEYKPEFDNRKETVWHALVEDGIVPNNHADLIRTLQIIHDAYNPDLWAERLTKIAKHCGLQP